ncbi:MAG: 5-formyltetrahydrofolate cyclo-ligase [Undibacterium sp.]|nr:5-formyltetrahydrofolate cyclo-ligase [Undibacterium sp.]
MTQQSTSENEESSKRQTLRRELLSLRRNFSPENRLAWNQAISQGLLSLFEAEKPQCLAVYWPIQGEPDLLASYQVLHQMGISLALPVVVGKNCALEFAAWAPHDVMDIDSYGIPTPLSSAKRVQPDTLLIPCVGFNTNNYRLGYGGGYYDRTLAQIPACHTIGIAYKNTCVSFEPNQYDIAMARIITEEI